MTHLISIEDQDFRNQVEACEFPVPKFDHRAHLRLAYIYLVDGSTKQTIQCMRDALMGLLKHAGANPSKKYHESLT